MRELNSMRTCPFYQNERKSKDKSVVLYCEKLRITFPSKECRRRIIYGYCANNGYKDGKECEWHRELMKYYNEEDERS